MAAIPEHNNAGAKSQRGRRGRAVLLLGYPRYQRHLHPAAAAAAAAAATAATATAAAATAANVDDDDDDDDDDDGHGVDERKGTAVDYTDRGYCGGGEGRSARKGRREGMKRRIENKETGKDWVKVKSVATER
jgi:hypothetical protein